MNDGEFINFKKWNMFKVNNKDTRTTPLAPCSSVSIVNFENVIGGWKGVHGRYYQNQYTTVKS